jgi:hypothetical protein
MCQKMFWNLLKQKFKQFFVDPFWPMCPSGRPHRTYGHVITSETGKHYCQNWQCLDAIHDEWIALAEEIHEKENPEITLGIGSGDGNSFVRGDYESIKLLQVKLLELERLRREVQKHEYKYTQAFTLGLQSGNQMDLQLLIDTLLETRLQLLEKAAQTGILETRVHPYVTWYEQVRDSRMAPGSDVATYKVCKLIVKIESQIIAAQQELAKKNETISS